MSSRWFQVHVVRPIQPVLRWKCARPTAAVLTLLLVLPVAAMAQGSPFDTGFNAIQAFSPAPLRRLQVWLRLSSAATASRTANPAQKRRWLALPPERVLPFSR
jgi:hypothetical protein